MKIAHVVRDDIRILVNPEPFKGRCISLAYQSPFGGADIQLTVMDALGLSQALFNTAMEQVQSDGLLE